MREQNAIVRIAMNDGLYLGIALVLNSIIFYLLGKPFSEVNGYLSYAIIIAALSWSIYSFREFRGDEGLPYSTCLGFGTLLSLFASLIFAFFTFVLYKLVDPGLMDKLLNFLEENLMKQGTPDAQMEMLINLYKKFLTPLTFSIGQIMNLTFLGFFFSLIIAIFYKRRPSNPFQGIE